uniref:Uncharacterized protein n=1 Tax=Rhizophora mucronata TaxID=61149 RepID=A0A2P2QSI1_RHIMU
MERSQRGCFVKEK